MLGSYTRPPLVSDQWNVAQWERYKAAQFACRDRDVSSAWWETTGRHLVAMADANLRRLREQTPEGP